MSIRKQISLFHLLFILVAQDFIAFIDYVCAMFSSNLYVLMYVTWGKCQFFFVVYFIFLCLKIIKNGITLTWPVDLTGINSFKD